MITLSEIERAADERLRLAREAYIEALQRAADDAPGAADRLESAATELLIPLAEAHKDLQSFCQARMAAAGDRESHIEAAQRAMEVADAELLQIQRAEQAEMRAIGAKFKSRLKDAQAALERAKILRIEAERETDITAAPLNEIRRRLNLEPPNTARSATHDELARQFPNEDRWVARCFSLAFTMEQAQNGFKEIQQMRQDGIIQPGEISVMPGTNAVAHLR